MEDYVATFGLNSLRSSKSFQAYKFQFLEMVEGWLERSNGVKPQEITPPLIYPIWKSKTKCYWKQQSQHFMKVTLASVIST